MLEASLLQALVIIKAILGVNILLHFFDSELLSADFFFLDNLFNPDVAIDDVLEDLNWLNVDVLVADWNWDFLLLDTNLADGQVLVTNGQFCVANWHTGFFAHHLQLCMHDLNLRFLSLNTDFYCFNWVWILFWANHLILVRLWLNAFLCFELI